ncbi:S-formylglutathione hydrolase FrmB [Klebsiella quasivariicola]|nr:S-formylglutathione hydrolase FrmB [Klebsiella quasivariicola]
MERIEHHVCFGGSQEVWRHHSAVTGTPMTFSVFLPPQAKTEKCPVLYWLSGLTCNEQNFRHCCKVSDEAAFCLIQRPYISKTLLTRRISPRGSP